MEDNRKRIYFEAPIKGDSGEMMVSVEVPKEVCENGFYRFRFICQKSELLGGVVITFVPEDEDLQTIVYTNDKYTYNRFCLETSTGTFHAIIQVHIKGNRFISSIDYGW